MARGRAGSDRHAVPNWPDAAGEKAVSWRRRIMVSALVTTVALIGAAAVVGSGVRHSGAAADASSDRLTPWVDSPAEPPMNLARRSRRDDRRPCAVTDLNRPWVEEDETDDGRPAQVVLLPNGADSRCTLAGSARLVATNVATGMRVELPAGPVASVDSDVRQFPATVDPGEPARLDIVASGECAGAAGHYRDARLVVLGREFPLDRLRLGADCPVGIGSWYVQPPLLNAPLTAEIEAPTQVQRGQTLEYVVTLSTSRSSVRLDPCPTYRQALGSVGSYHQLNCVVTSVRAHEPVRFAMRLNVPGDAAVGLTTLRWMAVTASGEVVIGDLATGGRRIEVIA